MALPASSSNPDPSATSQLAGVGQEARNRPNPFATDVCADPLAVDETRSVAGMNRDIVSQIATAIDERQLSAGRAVGSPLMLLTAPRAGYGKTHLLGRVAAATGGQFCLVPLAFKLEDAISMSVVGLRGAEALGKAAGSRPGWSRLRDSAAGICAALLLRLIKDGRLPCANPDQAMRVLTTDPAEIFSAQGSARLIGEWLKKHFHQLRKPLAETALELIGRASIGDLEKWVQALLAAASEGDARSAAEVRALAAESGGDGCALWLRLLGLWRPPVLLVDHLDGFYRNEQAGLRIAMLLLDLAEVEGVHVVLSLNQDVWQATFGHHLPSALEDRLTASQVLLRGLGADEAVELVRLRLAQAGIAETEATQFLQFLDARRYFLGRPLGSVSARVFLRHAAQQWLAFQHSVEDAADLSPASASDEADILPVIQETRHAEDREAESASPDGISVFDSATGRYMQRVAEGLAEPLAALPQNDPPPAPAANIGPTPPLPPANSHPEAGPSALAQSAGLILEGDSSVAVSSQPTLGTAASARSAGAFEKLREMLDKLRTSEKAAPEVPATTALGSLPLNGSSESAAPRDVLLGRFEALRLQMSAEAESRGLDLARLADLVHLAGRRFPLVHESEVELPGLTGRTAARWQLQGAEILFGLGDLTDRRYWQTLSLFAAGRMAELAEQSARGVGAAPQFKLAAFKCDRDAAAWFALDQPEIFPAAVHDHLDAIHLDARSIAALYAMQRMIKEAESGALNAEPAQVMSVLARELDFFWKRVTRPLMQAR